MPINEYRCQACAETFELLVRSDKVITCPECGSSEVEKLISAPFVSSGQTDREPGQTCCGRAERCDIPPCTEGSPCWRG